MFSEDSRPIVVAVLRDRTCNLYRRVFKTSMYTISNVQMASTKNGGVVRDGTKSDFMEMSNCIVLMKKDMVK